MCSMQQSSLLAVICVPVLVIYMYVPLITATFIAYEGWSSWQSCSGGCSSTQSRSRDCKGAIVYPSASLYCGTTFCTSGSPHIKTRPCGSGGQGARDGNWGSWESWDSCSRTCGGGMQYRGRSCNNPAPDHCGQPCQGSYQDTQSCNSQTCCDNSRNGWLDWENWGPCSVSCGSGTMTSIRQCKSPSSSSCYYLCAGASSKTGTCNALGPRDGGWGRWNWWTGCSVTCGYGTRTRTRYCNSPTRNDCGSDCQGASNTAENCQMQDCCDNPTNGNWGNWGSWQSCSKTCGGGQQTRTRLCNNPVPVLPCGQQCQGSDQSSQSCNTQVCCEDSMYGWAGWETWGSCSVACGSGTKTSVRQCRSSSSSHCYSLCQGGSSKTATCSGAVSRDGGWSSWDTWNPCDVTCGSGTRTRQRQCNNPTPNDCGSQCSGDWRGNEPCQQPVCCVENLHGWGLWLTYGACSVTCGKGSKSRVRVCKGTEVRHCSLCRGDYQQSMDCQATDPVHGAWSSWGSPKSCSVTCGAGTTQRQRTCTNPAPNLCGRSCEGIDVTSVYCPGPVISCCQATGKSGATILVEPRNVTIGGNSTGKVEVTCKGDTCTNDALKRLEISLVPVEPPSTPLMYATADNSIDNGKVVKELHRPTDSTTVFGDTRTRQLITLIFQPECQDAGTFKCTVKIGRPSEADFIDVKEAGLQVTVLPSKFTVKTQTPPSRLIVGDPLVLVCSGNVGSMTPSTTIDIEWVYQNNGSSTWEKLVGGNVSSIVTARAGSCATMIEQRSLNITLTEDDVGRKYRCVLVKDGTRIDGDHDNDTFIHLEMDASAPPVSKADLKITPNPAVVETQFGPSVSFECQGGNTVNTLISLVLSYKAANDTLMQLAATDANATVDVFIEDREVNATGGLGEQLLNLTIHNITCRDNGTYVCAAGTQLKTSSTTDSTQKDLIIDVRPNRSKLTVTFSSNNELVLTCSTVTTNPNAATDIKWKWQYSLDGDTWKDMEIDRDYDDDPSKNTYMMVPDHGCFNVSVSILTVTDPKAHYYRCYVIEGTEVYDDFADVYTVGPDLNAGSATKAAYIDSLTLLWVLSGVILLIALLLTAFLLTRKKSDKRPPLVNSRRSSIQSIQVVPRYTGHAPSLTGTHSTASGLPLGLLAVADDASTYTDSEASTSMYSDTVTESSPESSYEEVIMYTAPGEVF